MLAAMGALYPQLKSQGELDIRLWFQYRCYSKQDPPLNQVKPTPLQVLSHISSIPTVSGDPFVMGDSNMIIITYFFLLHPGEYTESKSESTPFHLKDVSFSCCHSRATHEEFLAARTHAWQLFLSVAPEGDALILIFTFFFLFLKTIPLAPLAIIWPMARGDSDPPNDRKLAASRVTQTN